MYPLFGVSLHPFICLLIKKKRTFAALLLNSVLPLNEQQKKSHFCKRSGHEIKLFRTALEAKANTDVYRLVVSFNALPRIEF